MEKENIMVLTEEHILTKAATYVPMTIKESFVEAASSRCFDRMEISTEEGEPVPFLWKENMGRKTRFLAAALDRLYLHRLPEPEAEADPWEVTEEEFELLAESRVMSQLERMKKYSKNAEVRDRIYDLLADYHLLERMLNSECYGLLNAMNDPIARSQSMMSAAATPEALQALKEQAETAKKELESYLAGREGKQ